MATIKFDVTALKNYCDAHHTRLCLLSLTLEFLIGCTNYWNYRRQSLEGLLLCSPSKLSRVWKLQRIISMLYFETVSSKLLRIITMVTFVKSCQNFRGLQQGSPSSQSHQNFRGLLRNSISSMASRMSCPASVFFLFAWARVGSAGGVQREHRRRASGAAGLLIGHRQ